MVHSFTNPVRVFNSQVPTAFLEASVRSLIACYQRAYEESQKTYA
jgi:hypothetical protein